MSSARMRETARCRRKSTDGSTSWECMRWVWHRKRPMRANDSHARALGKSDPHLHRDPRVSRRCVIPDASISLHRFRACFACVDLTHTSVANVWVEFRLCAWWSNGTRTHTTRATQEKSSVRKIVSFEHGENCDALPTAATTTRGQQQRRRYRIRRTRTRNAHFRRISTSFSYENRSLCVEYQSIYSSDRRKSLKNREVVSFYILYLQFFIQWISVLFYVLDARLVSVCEFSIESIDELILLFTASSSTATATVRKSVQAMRER